MVPEILDQMHAKGCHNAIIISAAAKSWGARVKSWKKKLKQKQNAMIYALLAKLHWRVLTHSHGLIHSFIIETGLPARRREPSAS
jgi:acyl-CoA synthetase (NDP forming)